MSREEWMAAHALPKPTKRDRKRAGIDTTDMPFPKRHFDRDPEYCKWLLSKPCLLAWWKEQPCEGVIQAAHLGRGGRGIKGSDSTCVPLCGAHHLLVDAYVLHWQIVAHLWERLHELREEWWQRGKK